MFRGLNSVSLDAKGRIAIPARYRDLILEKAASQLVLTIDPEDCCLWLYTITKWEEIEVKLSNLPSFDPASRRIQRLLIGHAAELDMDRTGRILLPSLLREYAQLEKSVMMVGQGNKFELWGESQWRLARDGWLAQGLGNEEGAVPQTLQTISL